MILNGTDMDVVNWNDVVENSPETVHWNREKSRFFICYFSTFTILLSKRTSCMVATSRMICFCLRFVCKNCFTFHFIIIYL